MMKSLVLIVCLLFLSAPSLTFSEDAPAFKPLDLDVMITAGSPEKEGEVILLPLPAIQVEAEVAEAPRPRKSEYVRKVLMRWGVDPLPNITHGMTLRSLKGQEVSIYLEENAARRAKADLSVNDRVTLFGYHVYNSKHGPGILVSDFYRHTLTERFSEAVREFRAEMKGQKTEQKPGATNP